jgi:hypothetical protein
MPGSWPGIHVSEKSGTRRLGEKQIDIAHNAALRGDRSGSMLSKKVFLTGEPNFSAPPVHAARADVRDHLESQEGDHRASYVPDRGLQKRRQANTVFREIPGPAQFSTFSTASVKMSRATHFVSAAGLPQ